MATIALPRLSFPRPALPAFDGARLRGLLAHRYVGVGAAGLLLVAALAGLVKTLGPVARDPYAVRVSLDGAFSRAPQGWRQTLSPARGPLQVTQDVIRLSVRPLAAISGASWNRPGGALPPLAPGAPLPAAPQPERP